MIFSLQDLLAADSRYAAFNAVKKKHVYNNTLHRNSKNYSDYWESGIGHPERVLWDLQHIFEGDTAAEGRFNYYEKLR